MGNFRELLGKDLPDTLESDYREMPIDRIGAFSRGSRLGTLLWRLKYASDASCFKPAVFLLAKGTSLQSEIGKRVCAMAVSEWLMPNCLTCFGAKEMIFGQKRVTCPDCEGHGVKRYADKERDRYLGSRFKPWAKKYAAVMALLTGAEKSVNPVMHDQLEKP